MDSIIVVDNIFEGDDILVDDFNSALIKKIKNHPGWHLSNDEEIEKKLIDSDYSDCGMLLQSFYRDPKHNFEYHSEINSIADLLLEKILTNLPIGFTKIEPVRYLWNYYNRSSTGVIHRDIGEENKGNFCSIVYHLNDSDGETIIDDNQIVSKSGQCIVFNSKRLHKGTGPKDYISRYCLNIVFKYENLIIEDE